MRLGEQDLFQDAAILRTLLAGAAWFPFGAWGVLPNNISASPSYAYAGTIGRAGTIKAWYQGWRVVTTNTGAHYWTISILRADTGAVLLSFTTAAGAPDTWTLNSMTGLSTAITTGMVDLYMVCDKTGTPGNLMLPAPAMFVT